MKLASIMIAIPVAFAIAFSTAKSAAQTAKPLSEQTQKNLSTAMHGEAFAYAKYMAYAQEARKAGNTKLADLFEQTARTERFEHFAEEAKLAGLAGSDADNLRDAIEGESYETQTMYRKFAEQAEASGDHAVALRFREIGKDEARHRDAFLAELKKIEKSQRAANQ